MHGNSMRLVTDTTLVRRGDWPGTGGDALPLEAQALAKDAR
jgi:hypothetical protein